MAAIDPYLQAAAKRKATQLILRPGLQPILAFDTGNRPIGKPLNAGQIKKAIVEILSADHRKKLEEIGVIEASYTLDGTSFGIGLKQTEAGLEATFNVGGAFKEEIIDPMTSVEETDGKAETPKSAPTPTTSAIPKTGEPYINRYLREMVESKASDCHLCTGCHPMYRIDGDITEKRDTEPFSIEMLQKILFEIIEEEQIQEISDAGATDFAYEIKGVARYRFNIFQEHRGISASIRLIPSEVLTADQLNLPPAVRMLATLPKGLVVVTGPTGSGKSTTLAAIVDLVNESRNDHILTIEAPIEFLHPNKKCLVHQREVGNHTTGFKDALRDALREDPDVVLVGEMRDLETISTAIETANTGHLVFGTLHTTTATSTINRIIDIFPTEEQAQIRFMLAESLKAVIAQNLLKRVGGGRVAAQEILLVTPSVSSLIREGKTHQILNVMQTSKSVGMQMLNEELLNLVKKQIVDPAEAYAKAVDKDALANNYLQNGISFTPPKDPLR